MGEVSKERLERMLAMIIEGAQNLWDVVGDNVELQIVVVKNGRVVKMYRPEEGQEFLDDSSLQLSKEELLSVIEYFSEMGVDIDADERWVESLSNRQLV